MELEVRLVNNLCVPLRYHQVLLYNISEAEYVPTYLLPSKPAIVKYISNNLADIRLELLCSVKIFSYQLSFKIYSSGLEFTSEFLMESSHRQSQFRGVPPKDSFSIRETRASTSGNRKASWHLHEYTIMSNSQGNELLMRAVRSYTEKYTTFWSNLSEQYVPGWATITGSVDPSRIAGPLLDSIQSTNDISYPDRPYSYTDKASVHRLVVMKICNYTSSPLKLLPPERTRSTLEGCKWDRWPIDKIEARRSSIMGVYTENIFNGLSIFLKYRFFPPLMGNFSVTMSLQLTQSQLGKVTVDPRLISRNFHEGDRKTIAELENVTELVFESRFKVITHKQDVNKTFVVIHIVDAHDLPPIDVISARLLGPEANGKYRPTIESGLIRRLGDKSRTCKTELPYYEAVGTDVAEGRLIWQNGVELLNDLWASLQEEADSSSVLKPYHDDPPLYKLDVKLHRKFLKRISQLNIPSWQAYIATLLTVSKFDTRYGEDNNQQVAPSEKMNNKMDKFLYGRFDGSRSKSNNSNRRFDHDVKRCNLLLVWEIAGERYRKLYTPSDKIFLTNEVPSGTLNDLQTLIYGATSPPSICPMPHWFLAQNRLDMLCKDVYFGKRNHPFNKSVVQYMLNRALSEIGICIATAIQNYVICTNKEIKDYKSLVAWFNNNLEGSGLWPSISSITRYRNTKEYINDIPPAFCVDLYGTSVLLRAVWSDALLEYFRLSPEYDINMFPSLYDKVITRWSKFEIPTEDDLQQFFKIVRSIVDSIKGIRVTEVLDQVVEPILAIVHEMTMKDNT